MQEDALLADLPHHLAKHEQLYFLHMAKTAGRSFESFLKRFFPPEQTLRIDVEHGYPTDISAQVLTDYRLYMGHLGYHFVDLFPAKKKPLWITMLRDPIDRVVSYYYFFRNAKPVKPGHISYKHQVMANDLSLLQFVESGEASELVENYQFHNLIDSQMLYFSTKDRLQFRGFKSNEELLTIAEHRLQDECIFLGITERYDTSVALLCFTFGWDFPNQNIEKLNVTPDRPSKEAIPTEVLKAIQKRVLLDIELYTFACGLFEKRLSGMMRHLISSERNASRTTIGNSIPISREDPPGQDRENVLQKARANSSRLSASLRLLVLAQHKLSVAWLIFRIKSGILKPPRLFDAEWYLQQNPDVKNNGMNPYLHYRIFGWKEGRNPSPQIDVVWYLSSNPDVLKAGTEPLSHYSSHGQREKRPPLPPSNTVPQNATATAIANLETSRQSVLSKQKT